MWPAVQTFAHDSVRLGTRLAALDVCADPRPCPMQATWVVSAGTIGTNDFDCARRPTLPLGYAPKELAPRRDLNGQ
jgi:hypothetical protein